MQKRLPPETFMLDVENIKKGLYTDAYFNRTREILYKDQRNVNVLMQVFTRENGILCGMDEAIAILKLCADFPEKLTIKALNDGDTIKKGETVLTIEGNYVSFAHLETVYLGVLSRGTSIATAVSEAVIAAGEKPVLFFGSRFDHYRVQFSDGYAAIKGGAKGVSTDANGFYSGVNGIGTIPHSLIAAYGGDTLSACKAFRKYLSEKIELIALVDFDNDCIGTSLKVANHFGEKLWGVRLDTAGDLRDVSVTPVGKESLGVCAELVWKLRKKLDSEGFKYVKIIISGGFNVEKIKNFVQLGIPFDAVGVGSSFFRTKIDFTADIVMLEGKHCAKVGRKFNPNPRLEFVN